jgi:hypothetical protein
MPTSLNVKKSWLSFCVNYAVNTRSVNNVFKPCKPHMAYWFTNTVYILMNQSRKKFSYKEVSSLYSQTPQKRLKVQAGETKN